MDRFDASHGGQQQQQYRQPPRGQQQQQPSPTTFNPPPGQVHPLPSLYHVLPGGQQQQQHPQQQQQQLLAQQVVGGGGAIRSPLLHQQQQHYAAQQQQHRQQHQQHQQQHQQHQQQQQQHQQQQHAHQQQHQLQQQQYPAFSANPGPYGQQQYNGGHLGGQQQQHPTLHQQQHPASHLGYGSSNGLTFMNPSQPASSAAGSARSHSPFSDAGEDQPSAKRVKREGAGDVKTPGGGGGTGTGGGAKNSAGGGRSEAGGDDDDGDTKGGKGKKRAVQSCSECRRRKIRCDRKFPCSPCSQRGDEAICREVEKHSASSTGCASSSDLLAISHRLAALESVLKDNGTIRAGEVDARAGKKGKAPTGGKLDAHWKNGDIVAVLGTGTGEGGGGGASETGRGGQGSSGRGRMKGGLRGGGQEGGRGGGGSGQSQRETVSGNDDDDKDVSADGRSDGDGEIDGNGDGHNSVDSETEGAAITLEHLAFGRRKDEPGRGTARQRPQSPSLDSSPQNDLAGAGQGGSLSRRSSLSHSGLFSTSSYIPEGNSAVAGGSNASDNSGGAGGSATDGNGGAAGGTGSTSTSASGGRNEQQLALITRDSNNGSTSQAGIVDSPVDSSPAARKLSPLPPGATSFSLLNKKSIVAIGDQAPRGNYGGPFGMPHLPALGTFGRAPVPEGSIEDRKIQQRDFTDAKVVFDTFFRRSDIFMEAFISCMPGRPKERALVNHYFRKVEWFHHCIHVPTFLSECEEYWSIGHERAVAECSASWIGLFLLILCLSLHFMDDEEAARYGFTPEEQQTLPGTWFAGTRGALWQSDFLTNHSLECLQIIILSGVYLNNQDRADAHWGILGAGIKIAHMMGINRLGAEETDVKPGQRPRVWRGRWESVIAREVGRRCWWQLVFLDWSLAPSYGYACSIHPNQMDTAFPANIHDEDLIEGQPIRPLPMTTHTPMSYHLTRARMTQTSYQVTLMMNAPVQPPYEVIMAIDADYKKLQANFPSYYCVNEETPMMPPPANQSDPDMIKHMEKIMCNLSLQTRRLRLHRPYLNRGYTQPKYAASTRECVKAARAALALIYNGAGSSGIANFLEKWWITLFYTFISAIVILIDLLHSNRDDDWDKKLTEVKQSVDILRAIERVSSPARGTLKVLEALISEVQNRPGGNQETPDSNPLDLDSTTTLGLQRTVRKLVHENASHPPTHGPGSSGSSTSVEPPSPQILLPNTPGVFGNRGGEAGGGPDVGNVSNGSSDGSASQQLGSYLSAIGGGLQVGGPSSPLPLSPSIGAFWPDNAGAGDHPGIPSATGANGASGFSFSNDDIAGTGAGQHLFPMSLSGYGGSGGLGGSGMGYSSADGNTPALRSATQGLQGPGNLESDLMSQIFSLQELDWIHMGPNGGGAL